jgi:hypothetical protein
MKFNFWRTNDAQTGLLTPPRTEATGLFGFLFGRIEVLLLLLMMTLAYNMHDLFVGYIAKNATFIEDVSGKFYFATRLIEALLLVEIVLALATAYFRNLNQWDKSLFTALIAFLIALANHFTITELFKDFANQISVEARTAIEWKMILSNALVFILGEAIGFVMHSKGQSAQGDTKEASILEKLEDTLNKFNASPTAHNGLYDNTGNPIQGTVFAQHQEQMPIGFQFNGFAPKAEVNRKPRGKALNYDRVYDLLDKGLKVREIAKVMNCTESIIHKIRRERNN